MRNVLFITAAILIGTSGAIAAEDSNSYINTRVETFPFGLPAVTDSAGNPVMSYRAGVPVLQGPSLIERDGPNEPASRGTVGQAEQDGPDCDRGGRGKGRGKGLGRGKGGHGKGLGRGNGGRGKGGHGRGGRGGRGKGGRGGSGK